MTDVAMVTPPGGVRRIVSPSAPQPSPTWKLAAFDSKGQRIREMSGYTECAPDEALSALQQTPGCVRIEHWRLTYILTPRTGWDRAEPTYDQGAAEVE